MIGDRLNSILYQIWEEERILHSLVTMDPAVATSTAGELDLIVPCLDVAATQAADH